MNYLNQVFCYNSRQREENELQLQGKLRSYQDNILHHETLKRCKMRLNKYEQLNK